MPAVLYCPRESHQGLKRISEFGKTPIHGQLVADGVQAGTGHNHRLGAAADFALGLGSEVLDHDPHLLFYGVRMQVHEGPEQVRGFGLVVARVVLNGLEQSPIGLVGGVTFQYVQDEPFFNGLAHTVKMKGSERPIGTAGTEKLQGLRFWGSGEGKGGNIGWLLPPRHLRQRRVVQVFVLRSGDVGILRFGLFQGRRGEHVSRPLGSLAGLGRVGLIHYQGESLARQFTNFLGNDWELLERGDDDGLARFQSFPELPGSGIYVLHHPQGLLELSHGCLELAVQHPSVGNHHDGVEDAAVFAVVESGQLMG